MLVFHTMRAILKDIKDLNIALNYFNEHLVTIHLSCPIKLSSFTEIN